MFLKTEKEGILNLFSNPTLVFFKRQTFTKNFTQGAQQPYKKEKQ